jgi:type II restriction/modification system DNA methylase subunit YeeA
MTPQEFVRKWRPVALTERQTAQEHFGDLCRLLGEPTPIEADPDGIDYAFEKGATRATGGKGWADVWKRGCFALEYKKRHANLGAALKQLLNYAGALANPPLLLTCDTDRIEINTNWNDVVSTQTVIRLEELLDPEKVQIVKNAFINPDALKPVKKRADVTAEAAKSFASLADRLRRRGHPPEQVAHFVNQLLFCLFAQDSQLFEDRLFEKFLRQARRSSVPEDLLRGLFALMARGGLYGLDRVEWFNGSLFKDDAVLPLNKDDLKILEDAAAMNWSAIEPAIFGTLFERGLDPGKRSQLGAHYTDAAMIGLIIDAVVTKPLLAEWAEVRQQVTQRLAAPAPEPTEPVPQKRRKASTPSLFGSLPTATPAGPRQRAASRAITPDAQAKEARDAFLDRLRKFRVLDPACGSGNFLYVALMALKDIELQVIIEAEELGVARVFPLIGPDSVLGLEINSYAVELARVTVWIGEIQWMRRKGYDFSRSPVLNALPGIVEQDAILDPATGKEPDWPPVDVIVGNPPFLGSKFHLRRLGGDYVQKLRAAYTGRVPPGADLVCYWFEKARAMAAGGQVRRIGLLATKSIANAEPSRQVLDRIVAA